jgi:hypothetical protein
LQAARRASLGATLVRGHVDVEPDETQAQCASWYYGSPPS